MKSRVLTTVAGLFCALAAQVGGTAAATETPAARSSETLRSRMAIDCRGTRRTAFPPPPARGRCTVAGAFTDRGTFVDSDILRVHPHGRTFTSAKGSIAFSVYRERGHWLVVLGTGAYAGLRGRGWESPPRDWASTGPCPVGCPFDFTMTGTVSR
jgi:hypothetical protein